MFSWFWSRIKIFVYIWFDRKFQALQLLYEPYLLILLLWNGRSRFMLPLKSKSAMELPIIAGENFSIFAFYISNERSSRVILKSKILGHFVLSLQNTTWNNDVVPILDPQMGFIQYLDNICGTVWSFYPGDVSNDRALTTVQYHPIRLIHSLCVKVPQAKYHYFGQEHFSYIPCDFSTPNMLLDEIAQLWSPASPL